MAESADDFQCLVREFDRVRMRKKLRQNAEKNEILTMRRERVVP